LASVKRRPNRAPRARAVRRDARTRTRRKRGLLGRLWPGARLRRRGWRALKRAPRLLQAGLVLALATGVFLAINWLYQVVRKPTELLFPVSGTLYKTPQETWLVYGPLFRRYATARVSAQLLAALAQVEGSGNPVVRTYWRWSWAGRPFELYRPASSAVGMYQITDGTFAEARHYCIRDHAVVRDGAWNDWRSCWLNGLYFRVIPSDAIELTSAYLDRHVAGTLAQLHLRGASRREAVELAAVIHLCGAGAGDSFARRGFALGPGERCGDQNAHAYVARVESMTALFERLAERG